MTCAAARRHGARIGLGTPGHWCDRYIGGTGAMIGMHTFGSSAPIKDPLKKFGSTPKKVLAAAKEQIAKTRRQTA
jgi:transketolase